MVALIDGDILIYRVGFTTQEEPIGIACARMDTLVENIIRGSGGKAYKMFLTSSDHSNYRFGLYPEYKANRTAAKPVWYNELRAHLLAEYSAEMIFGMEADDALGINQNKDSIICSIDKDLDQVPGMHYDFVKDVLYEVSEETALRFFYFQILTGDRVDNVPGCKGIGPKKADNALAGDESEEEYQATCLMLYESAYGLDKGYENLVLFGQLLKIKQKEDEALWVPEYLKEQRNLENEVD